MTTKKSNSAPKVGNRLLVKKPGETTFKPEFREYTGGSNSSSNTSTDFTQWVSGKPTSKPTTKKPVAKPVSKKPVAKPTSKKPVAKPTSSVKKPASYTQTSKPTGRSKIMINGRSR